MKTRNQIFNFSKNGLFEYFVLMVFLMSCFNGFSQQNKPNVLLIIADDMGIDVANGYQENERMPTTPNLDALRADSLTFSDTWSAPQCTPTRATIMSGKNMVLKQV